MSQVWESSLQTLSISLSLSPFQHTHPVAKIGSLSHTRKKHTLKAQMKSLYRYSGRHLYTPHIKPHELTHPLSLKLSLCLSHTQTSFRVFTHLLTYLLPHTQDTPSLSLSSYTQTFTYMLKHIRKQPLAISLSHTRDPNTHPHIFFILSFYLCQFERKF